MCWGSTCVTEKQIKPLLRAVAPIWEREDSDYPDYVKVPMANGCVVTYRRDVHQPIPQCLPAGERVRIIKERLYKKRGKQSEKAL